MADLTDPPFRRLIARLGGCGLFYSPMLSPAALRARKSYRQPVDTDLPGAPPLVAQLVPSCVEELLESLPLALEMTSPVAIDINMGCSAPRVRKGGAGSALLDNPQKAASIVSSAVREFDGPVSVKLRLPGVGEDRELFDFVSRLEDAGAAWLCVHGRLPREGFTRTARWDPVGHLVKRTKLPVIGSGDLFLADEAVRRLDSTGCAAVMLARGAIRNPWIFARTAALLEGHEAPVVTGDEACEAIMELLEDISQAYRGDGRGCARVGTMVKYFFDPLPFGRRVAYKIAASRDFQEQKNLAREFLEKLPPKAL